MFARSIKQGILLGACLLAVGTVTAAVPGLIHYQGRISVGGFAYDAAGQFKFALVNADASQTHWNSAADGNGDGQPDAHVPLTVSKGLYSVHLGDTVLSGMAALPPSVFTNDPIYLRVWFNDGTNGFQLLAPDQRVASVGYAMMAAGVADGSITAAKLATNLAAKVEAAALAGLTAVSPSSTDADLLAKGFAPFTSVPAPNWSNGSATDAPSARYEHSAVWTGTEFVVWGGVLQGNVLSALGGRYRPDTDAWTVTSPNEAPDARSGHSALWTGSQMIVWGGFSSVEYLNNGGRYTPNSQQWAPLNLAAAPEARSEHCAIWTGSRVIVWGGRTASSVLDSGGLYNPGTDLWQSLAVGNPPSARHLASGIWAGNRFIVWGGRGTTGDVNTGGRLTVASGTTPTEWQSTSLVNAPTARRSHTAVWTGQRMIIWGGLQNSSPLGTGAAYDPVANTWTLLATSGAPSARSGHCAVWTGAEMIIFGGEANGVVLSDGAAYNPLANQWRPLSNGGAPVARSGGAAAWTGSEMLVFGGKSDGQPLGALQRVNPQPAWHFYRKL